jgi:hypothetical protein
MPLTKVVVSLTLFPESEDVLARLAWNTNWQRWCIASIRTALYTALHTDWYLYFENSGQKDDSKRVSIEVRIDGPFANQKAANEWRLRFEINLLVQVSNELPDKDMIHRACGACSSALVETLIVSRLGNNPSVDTEAVLGCLQRKTGILVTYYGIVAPNMEVVQATVSADYEIQLLA